MLVSRTHPWLASQAVNQQLFFFLKAAVPVFCMCVLKYCFFTFWCGRI